MHARMSFSDREQPVLENQALIGRILVLLKIDMCPNVVPCVVHTDHKAPLLILWKNLCGSAPTAAAA